MLSYTINEFFEICYLFLRFKKRVNIFVIFSAKAGKIIINNFIIIWIIAKNKIITKTRLFNLVS
jgi:hypothetical protein